MLKVGTRGRLRYLIGINFDQNISFNINTIGALTPTYSHQNTACIALLVNLSPYSSHCYCACAENFLN